MAKLPIEDNFNDILGKAQRGLKLSTDQLAQKTGVTKADIERVMGGEFDETVVRKLAPALNLGPSQLVALGKKAWYPNDPGAIDGLACFNTPYEDMTVNSYLVWDPKTKQGVAFDSGADAGPMLAAIKEKGLKVPLILLTHTHGDHIIDLPKLKKQTGATAHVGKDEGFNEAEPFAPGKSFQAGGLKISTRQTSGHARGGVTYVVDGLGKKLAVVGDAMFAGSMGGGMISYDEALRTNRDNILSLPDDTVLCPGHGPLTTVGEEKKNNPFFTK